VKRSSHPLLAALLLATLSACAPPALPWQRTSAAPTTILVTPTAAPTVIAPTPGPTATPIASVGQGGGGVDELATPAVDGPQPLLLTGVMTFTSDYLLDSYVENTAILADMHGFVIRDQEWPIPLDGQVLGPLQFERAAGSASYTLRLPARPDGTFSDVDGDGERDAGLQIFNVGWSANLSGSAFETGDDQTLGWYNGFASTRHDPNTQGEVVGGRLLVWAPDARQEFPTGFGADGLLFTADDPVGPVEPGYSVIDLDQQPFARLRDPEQRLDLYEPTDITAKDYSELPYSEAFARLVADVRVGYAFNGIPGKEPAWDELLARLGPQVAEAERAGDAKAFYRALRAFTFGFNDGHVGLSAGNIGGEVFDEEAGGGFGLAMRETDDGRFFVTYVLPDGPAAEAGIARGAEIVSWNGLAIGAAVAAVEPFDGPYSSPVHKRYDQAIYLGRAAVGSEAEVGFANEGEAQQTARVTAISEYVSLFANSPSGYRDATTLPIEAEILEDGAGYLRINSNIDDLSLSLRLIERALAAFEEEGVDGLIVDLRDNSGGFRLNVAGYLTGESIPTGQRERFNTRTGVFEADGPRGEVRPKEQRFGFEQVVVLVGLACASACEEEAYALSQVPGAQVIGEYPSTGIYASVIPDEYRLPAGMTLQVSKYRYVTLEGTLFLEGTGVVPTIKVPVTRESVLSDEDVVLQAAEETLR
jgi:C-terminal processing protease CtpA/Prc